ncbi:DUF4166 domain-containing protein [Alphaproteobacteria bacterium KMM 3653]|uniref:DUF4166 domain-containing protein n=1 Tax=Harenicola maris TaxID=2841044 RepID=A0AAP2CMD0_9RHOB|nr:DUF4166 domain-containing protein [Harenicola maris]
MRVVIIGGYGVFGGRLARLLLQRGHEVVVAGRRLEAAREFAQEVGGSAARLDRDDADFARELRALSPEVVVDAAGPFQGYGAEPYRVARAAIAAGADYIDLSDAAEFTSGISGLDAEAQAAGMQVISGASSVPAVSSVIAGDMAADLSRVEVIETAICPGNRAPRGRSVMQAILGQVGAPLRLWRGGVWREMRGWSQTRQVEIAPDMKRPAALIGAPDLTLFPNHFKARSVVFRAGLDLRIMHYGLGVLSWLRAKRLLPPLERYDRPLRWVAERLEPFGRDTGGMICAVMGRGEDGAPLAREWRLTAREGLGPFVPVVPAMVIIEQLARGERRAGARPALEVMTRAELEAALGEVGFSIAAEARPAPVLFEQALGARWGEMPDVWRDMHEVWDMQSARGAAEITGPDGWAGRIIAALFRFPNAGRDTPVCVTMVRRGDTEVWQRDFAGRRFRSYLSPSKPRHVFERFGPFRFELELTGEGAVMGMEVRRGWCLGLPLPRRVLPRSETREYVAQGRFHFDVDLSLPRIGRLVRYQGWLEREGEAAQSPSA